MREQEYGKRTTVRWREGLALDSRRRRQEGKESRLWREGTRREIEGLCRQGVRRKHAKEQNWIVVA